jgi:hypothetical protein
MGDSRKSKLIDLRVRRLKDQARAKQQWLENMLSTAAASSGERTRRKQWIAVALDRIKRAQAEVAYRASLLDAYSEHLHVLEMTLMGASEEKSSKSSSAGNQPESAKS